MSKQTKLDMLEESECQKLDRFLTDFEFILHPRFLDAFKFQLGKCRQEDKREAYAAAKISDEALKIEAMIKSLKEDIKRTKGVGGIGNFHLKCFYKELLKMFADE